MFSVCRDRELTVPIHILDEGRSFKVKEWHNWDEFPVVAEEVGVDTETELITDTNHTPPLVVLGCYNPLDNTCYVVPHEDAKLFMEHLIVRGILIYLANAGFDYYELWSKQLEDHCSRGKVIDILIRAQLHEIATIGWQRSYSLKDLCVNHLKYEMNKHEEEGEASVRLNFRRSTEVTDEALKYLGIDCYTTYHGGLKIPKQPTEEVDTRGHIVLSHISNNGLLVDTKVFKYYENKLKIEKEKYRHVLLTYGFPDPEKKNIIPYTTQIINNWKQWQTEYIHKLLPNEKYNINTDAPGKKECIRLILYCCDVMQKGNSLAEFASLYVAIRNIGDKVLKKVEVTAWDELLEKYDFLGPLLICKKKGIWPCVVKCLIDNQVHGEEYAMNEVDKLIQDHPEWFAKDDGPGPVAYLQKHLMELSEAYPDLNLARTKTGRLKCSKKDIWKLEDCGIKDPFLESYTNYIHCQKYLSTYVNSEYIKSDGKVHTRFGMVTTSRTSSTRPNTQNLPSHDLAYPLKLMYKAPEGSILVSTDYSFAELVALSQDCLTEFKKSALADVINAGVCPHRYAAAINAGILKPDTSFCKDPQKAKEMENFLKSNISKDLRSTAKACNFGLPGGMRTPRFHQHLRENNIKATMEETDVLRKAWFKAFPEMNKFMDRAPIKSDIYKTYGLNRFDTEENEDEEEEDENTNTENTSTAKQLFKSETITGFIRNRATFNASLNTRFQQPVANLAKRALWNLERYILPNGDRLGDRLVNFVHDEIIYWLYPEEVWEQAPLIKKLWLAPGKDVFPDVKLKAEIALSYHWDKQAAEWPDIKWTEDHIPILEEPDIIKEIYKQ